MAPAKSGSSTKNQQKEIRDSIDISGSEMEKNADRSISPKITASPSENISAGESRKSSSQESRWKEFGAGSDNALTLLNPQELPSEIISAIGAALGIEHFALWIPNITASLITADSIIELPPGSVITLVFRDTDPADLPSDYEQGKAYLLPS